ncbi:hypothetical protein LSUE1_G008388 [Lachnellula suecica]|uniref:Zn(2)-C6 fungal-type domain-containing protein n=1 Tax=Lachnellula suecica TaxID=602035 RepID=A0A8T9BY75_9HELO|nr:hypothetical protein LSUE1_G008388 [Lachnellula suecica]
MVYCGKPSKGCQACRDRKTRCDRLTPSCSQCTRAHRACPGYRDQLDLMFRNESEAVVGKAKAREKSKAKQKESVTPPSSTPVSLSSSSENDDDAEEEGLRRELARFAVQQPNQLVGGFIAGQVPGFMNVAPSFGPSTDLQHRAQAFFYTKSSSWLQSYDLLGALCSQTSADQHLMASMSACGLASLSTYLHTPELLQRSRQDYVTALRLTNAALRSPTDVKKDSTLFSVMILSIYETITGSDGKSLSAWTKHVNGAAALVKLRGRDQFKTSSGQRLFIQVLSYLMISCITRTIAMPDHMIELRKIATKYLDSNKDAWKASEVIVDFTVMRAGIREGAILGPRNIVETSLALDKRFTDLFRGDLGEDFRYKTVYTTENPHLVWNGFYHVYSTHWTAQIMNAIRTSRILLHEQVRDQLLVDSTAQAPNFTTEEMERQSRASEDVMLECQRDVLASVPQHTASMNNEPMSLLEGSRGYFIVWPLYLCGVMDIVTQDVKAWVVQRMRSLADVGGISQARVLADYMERDQNPWEWVRKPVPDIRKGIMENTGWNPRFEVMTPAFEEWEDGAEGMC